MTDPTQTYWKRVLVVAAVYVAAAWAAVEALLTVVDRFGFPTWLGALITALFLAGLPVTVFLVWRTAGADRRADPTTVTGALLFVVLATAAIFWFTRPPPALEESAVAVLPCAFEGSDDLAYRAEGLAEDVHARLSRVDALKIPSWHSSLFVRDKGYPPARIAEVLHVERLVQCRVKSTAERIELSAELVDPVADTVLWNEDYDFATTDLGTVMMELTGTLLDVLTVPVQAAERDRAKNVGTFSPEAYDHYLKARATFGPGGSVARRHEAEELLTRVLDIDPNYPEALVLLARAYMFSLYTEGGDEPEDLRWRLEEARSLARRALELDPGIFDARDVLAFVCGVSRTYLNEDCSSAEQNRLREEECEIRGDTAEGWACRHRLLTGPGDDNTLALERWLELEPTNVMANMQFAGALWNQGRRGEAMAIVDTLRTLEPDDYRSYGLVSNLLRTEGRLDEVLAWRREVVQSEMSDNPWGMARMATDYMNLGLYEQAETWGRRTLEKRRWSAFHFMPILWARSGQADRVVEELEALVDAYGREAPGTLMDAAAVYASVLKRFDRAKELYGQALATDDLRDLCDGDDACVVVHALQMARIKGAMDRKDEAVTWLNMAEAAFQRLPEYQPGNDAATTRTLALEATLRVEQGRYPDAIALLDQAVFGWETANADLSVPVWWLESDSLWDPLRDTPEFQALLDKYDAFLRPMRERVLEVEGTGDWQALRERTISWAQE